MLHFERLAEEKIREAIAAGELDNLQSKGKPLDLDEYASVPPEQRLTYIVMKNSGFLPPHLLYRRELEKEVEELQRFRDQCREQLENRLRALRSAIASQQALNTADATGETLPRKIGRLLREVFFSTPRKQTSSRSISTINERSVQSMRRAYLIERRWMRARLSRLAHDAEATAQLIEDTLIEKETREHKPFMLLLGAPYVSAKDILQKFDRDFPAII